MKRSRLFEEALRHIQELNYVLDKGRRVVSSSVPLAERVRRLNGEEGVEARAALRRLADSVGEMERYVTEGRESADDWRRRGEAAAARRDYDRADQARHRSIVAEYEVERCEKEIAEARLLLRHFSDAQIDWTRQ